MISRSIISTPSGISSCVLKRVAIEATFYIFISSTLLGVPRSRLIFFGTSRVAGRFLSSTSFESSPSTRCVPGLILFGKTRLAGHFLYHVSKNLQKVNCMWKNAARGAADGMIRRSIGHGLLLRASHIRDFHTLNWFLHCLFRNHGTRRSRSLSGAHGSAVLGHQAAARRAASLVASLVGSIIECKKKFKIGQTSKKRGTTALGRDVAFNASRAWNVK